MIEPFTLNPDGYHVTTKRRYAGKVRELVTSPTFAGQKYRAFFLGLEQPGRPNPKVYAACVHRRGLLDKTKCGLEIYGCAKHGTCSTARNSGVRLCQNCGEFQTLSPWQAEDLAERIEKDAGAELPHGWWQWPEVWPAFRLFISRQITHHKAHPLPAGQGDGIVIVGGGRYFPSTYCNIRLLRDHGCTLPIQLWYLGRHDEMPEKWQALVKPYGVECIDADKVRERHPMRIMNGFEVKFFAVAHSSFRRVLFLDADCFPMRDPSFVLNDMRFTAAGAMFWRDTITGSYEFVKPSVQEFFGIPAKQEWDLETGMFLIDKARWALPLALTVTLNAYSDLVYKVVYGDKTTPYLAARLTGYDYAIPPHAPSGGGWGLWQKWYGGENLFQHRIHCKPVLQPTHFHNSNQNRLWWGLRHEDKMKEYLQELRGKA